MKNQIDWSETVRKFGEEGLFSTKLKIMGANASVILSFGLRKEYYMNNKTKYNGEGYADPTAYGGMKEIIREENENDKRAFDLVKMLKYIIKLAGFELIERVQLRDTKSGREYK